MAPPAVSGISIDTRTIAPGELYVAIRGERLEGHDFVEAALAAGAAGAVINRPMGHLPPAAVSGRALIVVPDTTGALQRLARWVRRRSGARVVAVTGSAGKTTTKEATAAFLGLRHRVMRSSGNLNNHIGLPLSLLELRHGAEVAVVELGMNHAGEISRLVAIAEPDVRVWINVAEVHLEFFASVEAIADAKAEILEGATGKTALVANADDPRVMARAAGFAGDARHLRDGAGRHGEGDRDRGPGDRRHGGARRGRGRDGSDSRAAARARQPAERPGRRRRRPPVRRPAPRGCGAGGVAHAGRASWRRDPAGRRRDGGGRRVQLESARARGGAGGGGRRAPVHAPGGRARRDARARRPVRRAARGERPNRGGLGALAARHRRRHSGAGDGSRRRRGGDAWRAGLARRHERRGGRDRRARGAGGRCGAGEGVARRRDRARRRAPRRRFSGVSRASFVVSPKPGRAKAEDPRS